MNLAGLGIQIRSATRFPTVTMKWTCSQVYDVSSPGIRSATVRVMESYQNQRRADFGSGFRVSDGRQIQMREEPFMEQFKRDKSRQVELTAVIMSNRA